MQPTSVTPRLLIQLIVIIVLTWSLAGCAWDGNIYLNSNAEVDTTETPSTEQEDTNKDTETDSVNAEESDESTPTDDSDESTPTDDSDEPTPTDDSDESTPTDDSDEPLPSDTGDSANDTGNQNDDSESDTENSQYFAWQGAGLNIEIFWPSDYPYWNFIPEELCIYIIPASPDAYKPPGPERIEEISRMTPARCEEIGRDDLTPHYYIMLPMGTLSDVGDDLPFIAAILYRDGNHITDSPEENEDYFGYTNIARPTDNIYTPSFSRITLFPLDDGY